MGFSIHGLSPSQKHCKTVFLRLSRTVHCMFCPTKRWPKTLVKKRFEKSSQKSSQNPGMPSMYSKPHRMCYSTRVTARLQTKILCQHVTGCICTSPSITLVGLSGFGRCYHLFQPVFYHHSGAIYLVGACPWCSLHQEVFQT